MYYILVNGLIIYTTEDKEEAFRVASYNTFRYGGILEINNKHCRYYGAFAGISPRPDTDIINVDKLKQLDAKTILYDTLLEYLEIPKEKGTQIIKNALHSIMHILGYKTYKTPTKRGFTKVNDEEQSNDYEL